MTNDKINMDYTEKGVTSNTFRRDKETFTRFELFKEIDDLIKKEPNCFQNVKNHNFFIEGFLLSIVSFMVLMISWSWSCFEIQEANRIIYETYKKKIDEKDAEIQKLKDEIKK